MLSVVRKTFAKRFSIKKADYLLCAKENQPTLCHNIEAVFQEHLDQHPTDPKPEDKSPFLLKPLKKSRNRLEHRRCWVFADNENRES